MAKRSKKRKGRGLTASQMGRRGAAALNGRLTAEQRAESARRAATVRWDRYRAEQPAKVAS